MLIVVAAGALNHAAELGEWKTLCGIPLHSPAEVNPAEFTVTHNECLRHLAKRRIWES